ncbi:MAG: hypothetical protein IPI67_36405 [Myxococcales bacterium]|nr:hypothetical protein [Myxococcales bacterium]
MSGAHEAAVFAGLLALACHAAPAPETPVVETRVEGAPQASSADPVGQPPAREPMTEGEPQDPTWCGGRLIMFTKELGDARASEAKDKPGVHYQVRWSYGKDAPAALSRAQELSGRLSLSILEWVPEEDGYLRMELECGEVFLGDE